MPLLLILLPPAFAAPQNGSRTVAANRANPAAPDGESSSRRRTRPLPAPAAPAAEPSRAIPVEEHQPFLAASSAAAGSLASLAEQSPGTTLIIERIEIVGNRRIPRDTLKSRIFSREGDPLNPEALHRDFLALWNTQYFEDIRTEIEESPTRPDARVVVFYVRERPIVRRILYCKMPKPDETGCKKFDMIPESDILERFKERKVGLSIESRFDPTRIKRAEVVLKELLGERGRQFAVVRPTFERIAATNAVELVFNIDPGPKVKVGDINIEGNTAFSDRKIVRAMRNSRPYAVPMYFFDWNVMSKTYDRRKLSEDLEVGIRGLYQDNGYFQVVVKDPITKTEDTVNRGVFHGTWPIFGTKPGKKTNITIPIQEGDLFRMGRLVVRSVDPDKGLFFKPEYLVKIFPLKEGDIFAVDKIRKAFDDYKKLYGDFGFIDMTTEPSFDLDPEKKLVNFTLGIDEQKNYYVRRIEFSGNTTTRDKVIRREIYIDEGDLFNNRLWEVSLLKLNQLDFFEPLKPEHAEVKRNVKEGSVDILLKVKEKGKQSIGLTGGISGIAGSFIGISYQTNNLLGRGETLTFSADFGDRQRNFVFGYTNPYFLDRPIAAGFTVFSSKFSYNQARETSILLGQQVQIDAERAQNYDQKRTGFNVFASYPPRRLPFTRLGITYSLTSSDITAFSQASQLLFESLEFRQLEGTPSSLQGIVSSKIVPTISHNTVDNPQNPTSGKSFFYSFGLEGGFLGGNINTIVHTFEGKYFRPVNKRRNVLGFRGIAAFATGYGGVVLPPYNRFYSGGEDSVRGFDFFTISPWAFLPTDRLVPITFPDPTILGPDGQPLLRTIQVPVLGYVVTTPGGDTQFVGNAEYRIPLVGPVTLGIFFDMGVVGALRESQLQLSTSGLSRLQGIFPNTTINKQLEIVPGSNFHVRASTGAEIVVQLPIINAPFRLYWAYNPLRYTDTITTPRGDYFLTDQMIQDLKRIGVYDSLVVPRLNATLDVLQLQTRPIEPLKTFRFTVSRTF